LRHEVSQPANASSTAAAAAAVNRIYKRRVVYKSALARFRQRVQDMRRVLASKR
jgi:hypothetical protein